MIDHKEEVINGKRFRIGRITALAGSRILNALLASMAKIQPEKEESEEFNTLSSEERGNAAVQAMWIFAGNDLPREKYEEFQRICLQCCSFYPAEDSGPVPILMTNGRWADKELEYDMTLVGELIIRALQFNLSPFFVESASNQPAEAAVAPTRPQRTHPLMASPSAR